MQVLIGLFIAMFGAASQSSAPGEADEILTQLSKIRLDKKQIYMARDITIRRDVLSIALNRGLIAFLEPVMGKVTGAVFIGGGEIVAIPPDPIEKQQIYKFTGTPILNEPFQAAILRFTDSTYDEIKREISQHAQEDVSADDAAQFDAWDTALADRAKLLDLRLLADFLEPADKPLFMAELKGDKTGWFNVVFDARAPEEVSAFQVHDAGGTSVADVWASFNQRSEARNPEAVAHENKSPLDVLAYEIDGTAGPDKKIDAQVTMRSKSRIAGARVLHFALSPSLRMAALSTDNDEAVPFYQYPNASSLTAVLPRPLNLGQELTLKFSYAGTVDPRDPWYPSQGPQNIPAFKSSFPPPASEAGPIVTYLGQSVVPASYHDQWLFEGLSRYLAAMAIDDNDPGASVLHKVLDAARDELKPVENAGAIWLGQRLTSTVTPAGYRAVYSKGFWIIHMLRMMLRENSPAPAAPPVPPVLDDKFLAALREFVETYGGKTASTWDFEHVIEKYSGKKLDWFFDEWVFDTGLPTYTFDYKIESSGTDFIIEGTIKQFGVPDGFTMPVPLYGDGEYLGTVQVGDSEGEFRFRVMKKPAKIVIDPEGTILTATQ